MARAVAGRVRVATLAQMSAPRESTLLWSVAGGFLLAAGVVVVIAMRRSDDAPLPAPPIDTAEETATAEAASTAASAPSAPLVAAEFARAEVLVVEGSEPVPTTSDTTDAAAGGEGADNAAVAVVAPRGAPNVPPAASALQGLRLTVPIAQVLEPGLPRTRPSLADQRLNWMENLASSQAAEIQRVEAALAAEAQAGPIENERIRRQRLDSLKRVHSVLTSQVAQTRAERGLPPE